MQLFTDLLAATETQYDWSDALLTPGMPMILVTPSGNRPFNSRSITKEDIADLAKTAVSISYGDEGASLRERLDKGSIKPAIDISAPMLDGTPVSATNIRFRLTIVKALADGDITIVVRKIPAQIPTLAQLGLGLSTFTDVLQGSGLLLVTGPTRQGKSTVVASMVEALRLNKRVSHIVRIDNPIEFVHPVDTDCIVTQREIGLHATSYLEAAEDALRMAPGAITIAEIRDSNDAMAALNLGESGHLVLATMQSTTVEGAMLKLRALTSHQHGASDAIANSVKAVIRTALVPTIDGDHYRLAYEWIVNGGNEVPELLRNWNSQAIRNALRQRALGNFGSALNLSLHKLVLDKQINDEAGRAASNDLSNYSSMAPAFTVRS